MAVAIPAYGVATEKALLLAGEPTLVVDLNIRPVDIYSQFQALQKEIIEALRHPKEQPQVPTIEAEVVVG